MIVEKEEQVKPFTYAAGREKSHKFEALPRTVSVTYQNICSASCSIVTVWSGCLKIFIVDGI